MTELQDAINKAIKEVSGSPWSDKSAIGLVYEFVAAMQRDGFRFERDWQSMESAPKDGTPVLLQLRNPLPVQRAHLDGWEGLQFVGRHLGFVKGGFDIGWSFAAPVGYGGFTDEWFDGWKPLSEGPTK